MTKQDNELFSQHEHALDDHGCCPLCNSPLALKHGKKGSFLGCSAYPSCEYTRPLVEHEKVEDKLLVGTSCPKCQSELAVKQGRYGMFIGCSSFPDCDYIADMQEKEDAGVPCPSCSTGELFERSNRFGKTFYACDQYPKCKYVVNYPPVNQACPACGWPIMVERTMASGDVLVCPQKKCGHKIPR